MTRMTFCALAAVAMLGTACERHSASELTEGAEPGLAPAEVPANPAGAAPVAAPVEEKAPAPAAVPAATPVPSKFFPANQ